jgi:biotin synthase
VQNKTELTKKEPFSFTKDEVLRLLKEADPNLLMSAADAVRKEFLGEEIHLRGIIYISNRCSKNCLYCGLRRDSPVERYQLNEEEILKTAEKAVKSGCKTIVLQSGETAPAVNLFGIIKEIASWGVRVTLSLGIQPPELLLKLREAGASRYLLKQETTDRDLFERLHPDESFERRLKYQYMLREMGYQVGSGNIVGLPGQKLESLADDLLFFRDFGFDMLAIGPFIPSSYTPLAGYPAGSPTLTLKVLALARLLLPYSHIPATTALRALLNDPFLPLKGGANVVMPDFTPPREAKRYKIYDRSWTEAEKLVEDLKRWCKRESRVISKKTGDSERERWLSRTF